MKNYQDQKYIGAVESIQKNLNSCYYDYFSILKCIVKLLSSSNTLKYNPETVDKNHLP